MTSSHPGPPAPAPKLVPLPEVQGIILRGYEDLGEASFFLLQFSDAEAGRRWLRGIVTDVRNATARPKKDETAVNLAFTAAGLLALGLREVVPPKAPPPTPPASPASSWRAWTLPIAGGFSETWGGARRTRGPGGDRIPAPRTQRA